MFRHSANNIESIINEASKLFISGFDIKKNFHKTYDVFTDEKAFEKLAHFKNDFATIQRRQNEPKVRAYIADQCPRTQLANWKIDASEITGTPFIAIASPWGKEKIAHFLKQLFLEKDITRLYACGKKLNDSKSQFINWFTLSGTDGFTITHHDFNGKYSEEKDGSWTVDSILTERLKIQNNATKEIRELFITVIPTKDCHPIAVNDDNANIIREMAESKSQQPQRSIVHCMSGLGRTGTLILAEEIYKHAEIIFGSVNPVKEIMAILNRIRTNRESLVLTSDQFESAIRLGHYAYSKDLTHESVKTPANDRSHLPTVTSRSCSFFSDLGTMFLEGLRQIAKLSILYFIPFVFIDYTQPPKIDNKDDYRPRSRPGR